MSSLKKYYKGLDLIRIFSCVAVLLYHLNILKGGYSGNEATIKVHICGEVYFPGVYSLYSGSRIY